MPNTASENIAFAEENCGPWSILAVELYTVVQKPDPCYIFQ